MEIQSRDMRHDISSLLNLKVHDQLRIEVRFRINDQRSGGFLVHLGYCFTFEFEPDTGLESRVIITPEFPTD